MNDYLFGQLHNSRMAELYEIADMDRLAAQAAPASALRRYAQSRVARTDRSSAPRWTDRLRRAFRSGHGAQEPSGVAGHPC